MKWVSLRSFASSRECNFISLPACSTVSLRCPTCPTGRKALAKRLHASEIRLHAACVQSLRLKYHSTETISPASSSRAHSLCGVSQAARLLAGCTANATWPCFTSSTLHLMPALLTVGPPPGHSPQSRRKRMFHTSKAFSSISFDAGACGELHEKEASGRRC